MEKFKLQFFGFDGYEIQVIDNKLVIPKECTRETKKNIRNYAKGLKKLWKYSQTKSASESIVEGYKGTYHKSKWIRLMESRIRPETIVKIGEGSKFNVTSYIDGTYDITLI